MHHEAAPELYRMRRTHDCEAETTMPCGHSRVTLRVTVSSVRMPSRKLTLQVTREPWCAAAVGLNVSLELCRCETAASVAVEKTTILPVMRDSPFPPPPPFHSHSIFGLEPEQRPGAMQESSACCPSARVGTVTAGFWVRAGAEQDGLHVKALHVLLNSSGWSLETFLLEDNNNNNSLQLLQFLF